MSEIKVFAIHRDGKLEEAYPVMAKNYDDAVIDYTCDYAITPEDAGVELVEYAPANCWQPIETAPKDGRMLILFQPTLNTSLPGYWNHVNGQWQDWGDDYDIKRPTHWMFLPESPEVTHGR